jgi:hypothetical protein
MRRTSALAALSLLLSTSCFRLTVITGAPPSDKTIDLPWRNFFIAGLVSPDGEISTKEACPLGIAKYQTESSFLNGLVSVVTQHIYTPLHTTITCAAGPVKQGNGGGH